MERERSRRLIRSGVGKAGRLFCPRELVLPKAGPSAGQKSPSRQGPKCRVRR